MVKKTKTRKAMEAMRAQGRGEIPSDVEGSYTGTGENDSEPVQDADDL